jgi:hypothetical protein
VCVNQVHLAESEYAPVWKARASGGPEDKSRWRRYRINCGSPKNLGGGSGIGADSASQGSITITELTAHRAWGCGKRRKSNHVTAQHTIPGTG